MSCETCDPLRRALERTQKELEAALDELAKCRKRVELAETDSLASKQAEWKCCPRNAWGDGEHDKGCPFGTTLKELSDADEKLVAYAHGLRVMQERAERAEDERDALRSTVDKLKAELDKITRTAEAWAASDYQAPSPRCVAQHILNHEVPL